MHKLILVPAMLLLLLLSACSSAQTDSASSQDGPQQPCSEAGQHRASEYAPGQLVASTELEPDDDNEDFPTGARAWRVLYTSTGKDNTDLQLVCGVVIAPADPERIASAGPGGNGRMASWTHGTVGVQAHCQPSVQPERNIWGPMPGGFNVVAWGEPGKADGRRGTSQGGALQYMVERGWVVSATDYFADLEGGGLLEPYVIGRNEASNAIDAARAAHHLLRQVYPELSTTSYEYLTWGHSQGGHAAMWNAQLVNAYTAATRQPDDPELVLRGAALLAPASTIIVDPSRQPYTGYPYGLADWVVNQVVGPSLFGDRLGIKLGPALYSYILGAWATHSGGKTPRKGQLPAYPGDAANLDLTAVATDAGAETTTKMVDLCLVSQPLKVAELSLPYDAKDFLVPRLSDGVDIGGQVHGQVSRTCAGSPGKELDKWCRWMWYQTPGPLGRSPLPKLPKQDGALVPVYIADGTNDLIVRCRSVAPEPDTLPDQRDCLSHAFYQALADDAYCPSGSKARGNLQLDLWQENPDTTEANHFTVPGVASARDLVSPQFEGSPLERWMTAAMDQRLPNECATPRLMNPSGNPAGEHR